MTVQSLPEPQQKTAPRVEASMNLNHSPAPFRRSWAQYKGYLFLAPYLALFFGFLIFPLFYGFWLSLMNYEILSPEPPSFIGLANYREAMGDPYFWMAMRATALFVIMAVPLTVGLALLLAACIDVVPERRQGAYRLMIFLPTMITVSVAGILWRWFYHGEFGLFNALLAKFGIWIPWISDTDWAMKSIVLMTIWWAVGGPMVILLAGLKQIPVSYYEAAAIDGATGFRRFYHITLPLLRPVLLFVVVINVIGAFQVFGQTFMITRGGPELVTRVAVQYIYETAFNFYRMGYGAAMSWLLFLVIAIFSIIQFRAFRER
jgi:multiple sugar transport system permease protein